MKALTTLQQVHGIINALLILYTRVGEDYHPAGPYTVIILAGETNASFTVNVIDDSVFEESENFSLTFRDSLPINVIGAGRATVTIVDDDGGNVFESFVIRSY